MLPLDGTSGDPHDRLPASWRLSEFALASPDSTSLMLAMAKPAPLMTVESSPQTTEVVRRILVENPARAFAFRRIG